MVRSAANSAKPWFAASRILSRDQPDPSRQLSPGFKVTSVLHASNECRCNDRTDAWQFGQTTAIFSFTTNLANLPVEPANSVIHIGELVEEFEE
jgi:hypothetical protein